MPSPLSRPSRIDYKIVSPEWTVSACQHSRCPMVKVIFMKLSVKHATKMFSKNISKVKISLWVALSPPNRSTNWVTIQMVDYTGLKWAVPSFKLKVFSSHSYSDWWTMGCLYPSCWRSESRMCWPCNSLDYVNSKMKVRSDRDGQISRESEKLTSWFLV